MLIRLYRRHRRAGVAQCRQDTNCVKAPMRFAFQEDQSPGLFQQSTGSSGTPQLTILRLQRRGTRYPEAGRICRRGPRISWPRPFQKRRTRSDQADQVPPLKTRDDRVRRSRDAAECFIPEVLASVEAAAVPHWTRPSANAMVSSKILYWRTEHHVAHTCSWQDKRPCGL